MSDGILLRRLELLFLPVLLQGEPIADHHAVCGSVTILRSVHLIPTSIRVLRPQQLLELLVHAPVANYGFSVRVSFHIDRSGIAKK